MKNLFMTLLVLVLGAFGTWVALSANAEEQDRLGKSALKKAMIDHHIAIKKVYRAKEEKFTAFVPAHYAVFAGKNWEPIITILADVWETDGVDRVWVESPQYKGWLESPITIGMKP